MTREFPDWVKVGDRLEYIGPPRDIYTNIKSHFSYYSDHVVTEVRERNWLIGNDIAFVHMECRDPEGALCGGYSYVHRDHWKVNPC